MNCVCVANCDLREVQCENNCGVRHLMFKEYAYHLKHECESRPTECVNCHIILKKYEVDKHNLYFCRKRKDLCPLGCEQLFPIDEMEKHKSGCTHKIISCPDLCGEEYPAIKRMEHSRNHCTSRRVPCIMKCGVWVVFRIMDNHIRGAFWCFYLVSWLLLLVVLRVSICNWYSLCSFVLDTCPNRSIPCQWCSVPVVSKEYREHIADCNYQIKECPSKCTARVPENELKIHLASICPRRFVPCVQGCNIKVRQCDEVKHIELECGNRMVECPNRCHDRLDKVTMLPFKQVDVHTHHDCDKVRVFISFLWSLII